MNEFTKEELKLLFGGLQLWMEEILWKDEQDRSFRNELYKKTQSMIDNYCDHELNINNPMYKCIRCESKDINTLFKIKYGLHDWFLCKDCGSQFYEFVIDKNADNGCAWAKTHFKRKYQNTV